MTVVLLKGKYVPLLSTKDTSTSQLLCWPWASIYRCTLDSEYESLRSKMRRRKGAPWCRTKCVQIENMKVKNDLRTTQEAQAPFHQVSMATIRVCWILNKYQVTVDVQLTIKSVFVRTVHTPEISICIHVARTH